MSHRRLIGTLCVLLTLAALLAAAPDARADEPRRAPGGRHDGEHVLVGFRAGAPAQARAAAHAAERGSMRHRFDRLDIDVVEVPEGQDPVEVALRYERNPNVEFAEPNWEVGAVGVPDDTLFGEQYGLHNTGQRVTGGEQDLNVVESVPDADVDGPEGWDAGFGSGSFPSSGGARVAIIDTGIDRGHVDLLGKVKACASALAAIGVVTSGTCEDDNLHGTHVAGTVGALTNNGIGVAGVAPNAELAIFKALNAAGVGFLGDIVAGIEWSHTVAGARIISMSLGTTEHVDSLERAVQDADSNGALVIAAAGNDFQETTPNYPAYYAEVMSVSSVSQDGNLSFFSTCNNDVEIGAPGEDVWSTFPGNAYGVISGTSMATPHVSGAAAMVWWQNPSLTADQVRSRLKSTTEGSAFCAGAGRLNLARALGGDGSAESVAPGTIAGTVREHRSDVGLSGATVDCGPGGVATTSADGSYTITDVPSGMHSCTASATGYRSKTEGVTVEPDATTTLDFALRKKR